MISHVLLTSTSSIAFRLTFLRFDLDPKVATSLDASVWHDGFDLNFPKLTRLWQPLPP